MAKMVTLLEFEFAAPRSSSSSSSRWGCRLCEWIVEVMGRYLDFAAELRARSRSSRWKQEQNLRKKSIS
jgi:hypothetical protein